MHLQETGVRIWTLPLTAWGSRELVVASLYAEGMGWGGGKVGLKFRGHTFICRIEPGKAGPED